MPFEGTPSTSDEVAELKARLSKFETEEGRLSGLSYQPKSSDEVIITTTPKAGTTWLQQICHQIRSSKKGGDMSFDEISEVVPWLELAHDQGQDLNAPQYGHEDDIPRVFKTHAWEPHCPKGCKRIVMVRDPVDVAVSFYNFLDDWFFPTGAISTDEFVREFWLSRGTPTSRMINASYFDHFLSWYDARNAPDILFLFYEDLKADLKSEVTKIAKFMSTSKHNFCTEGTIDGVVELSSYEFMMNHGSKFDEKLSKVARNEACGLSPDAGMRRTKLNASKLGNGKIQLSNVVREEILMRWKLQMGAATGYNTYDELRAAMSKVASKA